jgi:hypothetical protein
VTRAGQEYEGDEKGRENNTQAVEQTKPAPKEHAHSSQTDLHVLPEQQPEGTVKPEDYTGSFNRGVGVRNHSVTSPQRPRLQQSEYIRNPEDVQTDPNTDNLDPVIIFPWRMAGKFDSIEQEDAFLVYPSNNSGSNTNALKTNMTDAGSLPSNMAELLLFDSEDDNREYYTETPISSSVEQTFAQAVDIPEKEYLVTSGSTYKEVREQNKMQEDTEENDERDVDDAEDEVNGDKIGLHKLADVIQIKQPNIPKRTFVSENLKMRISQLATGDRRHNPVADRVRSEEARYPTGPRSGQKGPALRTAAVSDRPRASSPLHAKTRAPDRNTRPEANKIMRDTSVDITTLRPQPLQRLQSNAKPSTRTPQGMTTALRASKSQNTSSSQLNSNYTRGTMSEPGALQVGRLRQEFVDYQAQGREYEMAFPRIRQIHLKTNSEAVPEMANEKQRTANINLFATGGYPTTENGVTHATDKAIGGNHNSKSGQNEATVGHRSRPVVRRKAMETSHGTFGARTRTKGRPPSLQTRPTHMQTAAEASTASDALKSFHNQQTGQEVVEHRPPESGAAGVTTMTSLGTDTRDFPRGEIPLDGLISVVGPIPKGFTDPATIQNLDVNHMGPFFHLPHPIQPEPFQTQIPNSVAALASTSETVPSTGVTGLNQDANVFRQHTPIAMVHSFSDDETIKAKIVRLPQTSVQNFPSFSDQQLKQAGHQTENSATLSTRGSQPPAGDRPVALLDAARHAAQSLYTKRLQEYFQQLQSYYAQQQHQ